MQPSPTPVSTDVLNRYARRGLITALLLILLLGAYAALVNLVPESGAARHASRLLLLLPVALVFAIAWIRAALPRGQRHVTPGHVRGIMQDELRQDSLRKAFRIAFIGVLMCQPVFGVTLSTVPVSGAPLLMAAATVLVGATLFLGTLLFCDRP